MFNPISLNNKRILITGASSGIGRAASIMMSKLGAEVVLVDIDEEGIEQTMKLCESVSHKVIINLKNAQEIKNSILEVSTTIGKLNGFVHCAGIPYLSPLKVISEKKVTDVFQINTYAAIELAKVFINKNVSFGTNDSIVLISSVYGNVGSSANVGYAMSKSALHGITKSLAIELAPRKVRVNCIAPGFVKTNMLDEVQNKLNQTEYFDKLNDLHPLGLGLPEDVASMICFLQSNMSTWITGSILNVDGGFTAQ